MISGPVSVMTLSRMSTAGLASRECRRRLNHVLRDSSTEAADELNKLELTTVWKLYVGCCRAAVCARVCRAAGDVAIHEATGGAAG